MKLYIDDNLPYRLGNEFREHHVVRHAKNMGWQDLKDGELVSVVSNEFDAMLTIDKSMRFQTMVKDRRLCIFVIDCISNRLSDPLPFVPNNLKELRTARPGEYRIIYPPS